MGLVGTEYWSVTHLLNVRLHYLHPDTGETTHMGYITWDPWDIPLRREDLRKKLVGPIAPGSGSARGGQRNESRPSLTH